MHRDYVVLSENQPDHNIVFTTHLQGVSNTSGLSPLLVQRPSGAGTGADTLRSASSTDAVSPAILEQVMLRPQSVIFMALPPKFPNSQYNILQSSRQP